MGLTKDITIKNDWSDITIADYYLLQEIEQPTDYFLLLTTLDSIEGISDVDLADIASNFKFVFTAPKPFEQKIKSFTISGRRFDAVYELEELTTMQYVDLQYYIKEPIKNIANILSIILIPNGHTYKDNYKINDIADLLLNNLNIQIAINLFGDIQSTLSILMTTFKGLFEGTTKIDDGEKYFDDEPVVENPNTFDAKWGYIYLAEKVKSLLGITLQEAWNIPIIEFLNYCTYIKEKSEYEAERIKDYKKK